MIVNRASSSSSPPSSPLPLPSSSSLVSPLIVRSFGASVVSLQAAPIEDNDDLGSSGSSKGESYEGDIDWDAEWKKVVEKRDQPSERPGKYKNEVERALLQTSKATAEQVKKVKIVKPEFNMKSLTGDAKFWIAVLAVISIGVSLISAAGVESYSNSNDSFYI